MQQRENAHVTIRKPDVSDPPEQGLAGDLVAGRYRLEEPLGRGGAGTVFRARHEALGTPVAIKLLNPTLATGPSRERFFREARMAANLGHPGIVRVMDLGATEDGCPFLVMECLEGQSVATFAHQQQRAWPHALVIVYDVLAALAAAHKADIVHRDLKPGNIFLARQQDSLVVKLLDFGIAKIQMTDEKSLTQTGELMGTPGYMSPEQLLNFKGVDKRTDLYSAGAVLYYLLVGVSPLGKGRTQQLLLRLFEGQVQTHPRQARPEIPEWLDALVASALSEKPDGRPRTAEEFLLALQRGMDKEGIQAETVRKEIALELPDVRRSQSFAAGKPASAPKPITSSELSTICNTQEGTPELATKDIAQLTATSDDIALSEEDMTETVSRPAVECPRSRDEADVASRPGRASDLALDDLPTMVNNSAAIRSGAERATVKQGSMEESLGLCVEEGMGTGPVVPSQTSTTPSGVQAARADAPERVRDSSEERRPPLNVPALVWGLVVTLSLIAIILWIIT